jgi:hypothetical protein
LTAESGNIARMRAFYDARVDDLNPGDYVLVQCTCGHTQLLTRSMLGTSDALAERKKNDRASFI